MLKYWSVSCDATVKISAYADVIKFEKNFLDWLETQGVEVQSNNTRAYICEEKEKNKEPIRS